MPFEVAGEFGIIGVGDRAELLRWLVWSRRGRFRRFLVAPRGDQAGGETNGGQQRHRDLEFRRSNGRKRTCRKRYRGGSRGLSRSDGGSGLDGGLKRGSPGGCGCGQREHCGLDTSALEAIVEPSASSANARGDGSLGATEKMGRFGTGQALEVAKHDRHAITLGENADLAADPFNDLGALGLVVRGRAARENRHRLPLSPPIFRQAGLPNNALGHAM